MFPIIKHRVQCTNTSVCIVSKNFNYIKKNASECLSIRWDYKKKKKEAQC